MNQTKHFGKKAFYPHRAHYEGKSGEALVKDLGIIKGLKILDLGCGDGTTALPAHLRTLDRNVRCCLASRS